MILDNRVDKWLQTELSDGRDCPFFGEKLTTNA